MGIDLVEVGRIGQALKNPRFRPRILSAAEDSYCRTPAAVAGRWAAKEAIYKAVGGNLSWLDIEIVNGAQGEPIAQFLKSGFLAEDHRIHVSISHERGFAIAVAVLERVPKAMAND